METDISYFRRRASEERTAALQARIPAPRDAHRELTKRYKDLVHAITAHEQRLGLELTRSEPPSRFINLSSHGLFSPGCTAGHGFKCD